MNPKRLQHLLRQSEQICIKYYIIPTHKQIQSLKELNMM
jgi:hypothetical protein